MTTPPYGAMPQDTGEFMLGRVAVTPVFLESNGQLDASTEDWTPTLIQSTLQKVETGVNWWVDTLATLHTVHTLEFAFDTTYAVNPVATRYEPISRVSNDFALWVQEFVAGVGFDTPGSLDADIRAFNDAQRQKMNADWAYTMFIVNSNHDADGGFAPGGSFSQAFAFAGGLFLVAPSTRPASTFAHETGHMFWAKDEYPGGASSTEHRGYYNTPNSNASDNPQPNFQQQPSIMASGSLLDYAYNNHVSPPSTLAMVGWQDSDGDGIFDVLDVPLKLTGTGYYDTADGAYKFRGAAKVGVLPNLNPEGLHNDITLNRISAIQYRIDGGNWTTVYEPDAYETDLDLSIPLAGSGQTIEIRAIDADTGVTSNVFQGRLGRADAVPQPGIDGFVWTDTNHNSQRDANEFGEAGWTVEVLSAGGEALELRHVVDPDALPEGTLSAGATPGAKITTIGPDSDGRAGVSAGTSSGPGTKVFTGYSRASQSWVADWTTASRRMLVEFATPTSVVEIDAIGTSGGSYGRIEGYDAAGNLLDRFTTPKLSDGQVATMRVESAVGAIASVKIGGHANSSVRLDKLRFGPQTKVSTGEKGQFSVPGLPTGTYLVKVSPSGGQYTWANNGGNLQSTTVTAGSITNDVDFAFQPASSGSPWTNPANAFDVNDDQLVSALDVLLIVNDINQHGPHALAAPDSPPRPFVDVTGDIFLSALDALRIVNFINSGGAGEGEGAVAKAAAAGATSETVLQADAGAPVGEATPGTEETILHPTSVLLLHDEALLAMRDEFEALALELQAFSETVPGRRSTDSAS